jgi:hypothetical protein
VKKPGKNEYRQACDYRPANAQTEPIAGCMPILLAITEWVKGMKFFGLFDFLKGFWQLPLSPESREFLSYMTHDTVYTPTRVPQGCTDAALYFQQTMETCFKTLLYKHLLVWIDDVLLYAADIETYLRKLDEFFSLLDHFGLKLSVRKSSLFQTSVKWCGKIITGEGVSHDPERIEALSTMPEPTTAAELQQFICAANWMRESVIDYGRKVQALQRCLDRALSGGKRTKRAAAGIKIAMTEDERACFVNLKLALRSSAEMAHPDDSATTCLLTDASDVGWAIIVTQVRDWQPGVPVQEQQHKLLVCMGGSFEGPQANWSVVEKEGYPIVTACDKLHYLLLRPQGFKMFCDHRNLIHIFAPTAETKKHVRGKLLRWAMRLTEYRYTIEHIEGIQNVWADMVSRWAGATINTTSRIRRITTRSKQADGQQPLLRPLDEEGFVWPSLNDVFAAQRRHRAATTTSAMRLGEHDVWMIGDKIWIPEEEKDLIQRICIIAHCGPRGHRGKAAMINDIQRIFDIKHLQRTVAKFLKRCLLCQHIKGGRIVQRPWGETYRCAERNGAMHWDFLYLGESFGPSKYLLVMKDDATHFCELTVCDGPTSSVAVEAMLDWYSRYGPPHTWISDNGSHFTSEVINELCKRLKCKQSFTIAYSPWINGSIERLNRDVLTVLRALLLEYKLHTHDWPSLIPTVQASLNHTALPSLGNHAPMELFTGLPRPSPLHDAFLLSNKKQPLVTADPATITAIIDGIRQAIKDMHQDTLSAREKQTLLNKKQARGESLVNFSVGDYVLRSRVDEKHKDKLLVSWIGPYVVVRADKNSFRVKSLTNGKELSVHASRLKFYADNELNVTDELIQHVSSQGTVLDVDELKGHAWNARTRDYDLQVAWVGLEEIEDSWEPLKALMKDIPLLVQRYILSADDNELKLHWERLSSQVGTGRNADRNK